MLKKIPLFILLFMFIILVTLHAGDKMTVPHHSTMKNLNCSACHNCPIPSKEDPCFKFDARAFQNESRKLTKDLLPPDKVIINALEDRYEATVFSHKVHAHMAETTLYCAECHHYSPVNEVKPPCKKCHSPGEEREDLGRVGLKGAYHRKCVGCHTQWSKDTNCEVCHTEKSKKSSGAVVLPQYRGAKEPEKNVYQTSYAGGAYVTFFHNNHATMYGLSCTDCHRNQDCVFCHYQKEKLAVVTAENKHDKCSSCHDVTTATQCSKCHAETEKKGFDHLQATGWALNVYHQKLSCTSCHPENKPIGKLNRSCNSCHSKWQPANFKHAIVGLALDETHAEMECSDCHADRRFDRKPSCSGCHDDLTYPKDKPGKVTKKGK